MSDVIKELLKLDWDFESRSNSKGIHDIHPYPAKFIPEIPKQLISKLYQKNGTSVFDPFCGSGTTLLTSQQLGISAVGVDLNPIACLISEVKTSPLARNLLKIAEEVVDVSRCLYPSVEDVNYIPNLDHWFKKDIQTAIISLKLEINKIEPISIRKSLQLCLSSILVRVSNQDSDTRYAAIEKNINRTDVYKLFITSVRKLVEAKSRNHINNAKVKVINNDILSLRPQAIKRDIGLVITSPPYPNAYEYWLYHKYRMFWLDHDPISVKEKEIGARAHFFKKNHHTKDDFFHQMTGTFALIRSVLINDGYAAFVVGRSKIHGEIVDNSEIVRKAAEKNSFKYIGKITRTIKSSRKSFNLSHANIKEEQIVIVQNKL